MPDSKMITKRLIAELEAARQRIASLESVATGCKRAEDAVLASEQRFRLLITESKQAEAALKEHVVFFESLERLERAIREAPDMEGMMRDALDVVLDVMEADRAWLVYPFDPETEFWSAPMERTRPEWPGASVLGVKVLLTPELREQWRHFLASKEPVAVGPGGDWPVEPAIRESFSVQAYLAMALYPKIDQPWQFGVHQCSCERIWTARDKALLKAMGGRIQDALNSLLFLRDLRESEERYRLLYLNTPAMLHSMNTEGRLVEVSDTWCEKIGYDREEVLGRFILDFLTEDSKRIAREVSWPRFYSTGHVEDIPYQFITKSGQIIEVLLSAKSERDARGTIIRSLAVLADVTERKRAEDALVKAKDAAEAASKAKSEFLANMSHEIRTPLNGVLGMLQLLETTAPTDEQQEYLLAAMTSTKRLTRLLADILDLSRIEAGKMRIVEAEFNIKETRDSIKELFDAEARAKGLTLAFGRDENLPLVLVGDEARLRQILFNLVGNAIKFTERGEVRVEAFVLPHSPGSSTRVLVTVSDTGIGIPDEKLANIFEPFVQAEGAYTRRFQGAGLGLSIVRKLVKLMGGELAIDNTPGAGTTVYLSLPFTLPGAPQGCAPQAASAARPLAVAHGRILLAEDDAVSARVGTRMLEKAGYSVTVARDGREALTLHAGQDFDLILMDIQMPVLDGVEAARAIRGAASLGAKSRIPIIAMTAYAMTGDRETFLAAGMDDYLAKPVEQAALLEAIERVMGRRARDAREGQRREC